MKILKDDKGVSEIFGNLLILGILITALAIVIVVSISSIQNSKDEAQTNQVGQAFTVADSRISKARFSTSIFQESLFSLSDGTIYVKSGQNNSYINVTYSSLHGDINNQSLYYSPLGSIECFVSDDIVGYQNGGIWKRDLQNNSVMISPPNFDYNGVTLTLPITCIRGNDSMDYSGSIALIDVNSTGIPELKFPGGNYSNPLKSGYFNIYIKSDYAEAWKDYINERSPGSAKLLAPNLVYANLSSGWGRQYGNPEKGFYTNGMNISNYVPIYQFNFSFITSNPGDDYWINYDSGQQSGKPSLHMYIGRETGHYNKNYSQVEITYNNETGSEEKFWGLIPHERKSDTELLVNMLDKNSTVQYTEGGVSYGVMIYQTPGTTFSWGTNPNSTDNGIIPYYDSSEISQGGYKSLYNVTQHYLWLMASAYAPPGQSFSEGPTYSLTKGANNGAHGFTDSSNFILIYDSNQRIKYMYITEAALDVKLNARG